MSEGIIVALISVAGAIIGAAITAFGSIAAAERKNNNSQLGCGLLGFIASAGALGGLVLGAVFAVLLTQYTGSQPSIQSSQSSTPTTTSTKISSPLSNSSSCPLIVIEGKINGLPIAQTITWSELSAQGTTKEPQSSDLNAICSRDEDNEVQVFWGYWNEDTRYLEDRGSMTPNEALSLVNQNLNLPVIIVPWGE